MGVPCLFSGLLIYIFSDVFVELLIHLLLQFFPGLVSLNLFWCYIPTESIDIKQGIRQGAKLSTLLYKRYNNTILDSITKSTLGATIGNITVSAPACADEV
jgi:hypothetical protein